MSSVLKTFEMVLGEIDFGGNFLYENVKMEDGANHSAQILLVFFIVYGTLIIMNLLVALMVNKMDERKSEIILAKQRIEEISSMADITSLICTCCRKFSSIPKIEYSNKVCITALPKGMLILVVLFHDTYNFFWLPLQVTMVMLFKMNVIV